ncbi:MAG: hypothetical protein LBF68_05255 [Christensenellaceae bacterium]|jgi:hypothetical protein|nr:hypothetical protein [Christensenellaceae bacterium]
MSNDTTENIQLDQMKLERLKKEIIEAEKDFMSETSAPTTRVDMIDKIMKLIKSEVKNEN